MHSLPLPGPRKVPRPQTTPLVPLTCQPSAKRSVRSLHAHPVLPLNGLSRVMEVLQQHHMAGTPHPAQPAPLPPKTQDTINPPKQLPLHLACRTVPDKPPREGHCNSCTMSGSTMSGKAEARHCCCPSHPHKPPSCLFTLNVSMGCSENTAPSQVVPGWFCQ